MSNTERIEADIAELLEIALIASRNNMPEEAEAILLAVDKLIPDHTETSIVRAMTLVNNGEHDEAVRLLKTLAESDELDNHKVKAFLGLALHMKGETIASREVLRELMENDRDELARTFAEKILDLAPANN
ncbi:MAG: hypothetical protein GF344_13345 [Chitinivibrionales bacterium]|nr:hypothetical protein [Chitinivibrionales bacterium]MBD3357715.1 hypothetical protein [Chitinivibrionales bacterium]